VRSRSVAAAVAWRSIHNFFTNPALLIPSLLFPLFFFVAFAGGLSRLGDAPGFNFPSGYTAFQFVFVLMQSAAFGGVFTGFAIARDFESGFGRRLLLAAPNRGAILVGYWASAAARAAFVWVLLTTIALATGMQVGGDGVALVGMYSLAVIVNFLGVMWAAGIALRFRSIQAAPLMQTPVFLILFLAPVYVPLGLLSGWVHTVAKYNPLTLMIETGRDFISGGDPRVLFAYAVGLGLMVVLAGWAVRGLGSAEAAG
jgi:ABC-2 type transport system permease protein